MLLENVRNLLSIDGGRTFARIVDELRTRGYFVTHQVMDSKWYGSPQSRKRLFLVADLRRPFVFPPPAANHTLTPVSTILLPVTKTDAFPNYEDKYRLQACPRSGREEDAAPRGCRRLFQLVHRATGKSNRQGERVYSVDACGPTICANSGGPGGSTGLYWVDGRVRRLSVPETIRMFGFPDDYQWADQVTPRRMLYHLGNSIVVDVARHLVRSHAFA